MRRLRLSRPRYHQRLPTPALARRSILFACDNIILNRVETRSFAIGNAEHFKTLKVIGRARILARDTSRCTRSHQTLLCWDWRVWPVRLLTVVVLMPLLW